VPDERGTNVAAVKDFLKTTIIGGMVFLVPLVVLVIVLRHAMRLAGPLAHAITARFPSHEIAGVAVASIVAALILVFLSFLAGLFARTRAGRRAKAWLEDSLLGRLPQYRLLKSMADGLANIEDAHELTPVLISIGDGWQPGYQLEPMQAGWIAVFVPQAPTPMIGNILYMPAAKVRPANIRIGEAMKLVKCMGVGSSRAMQGVDLTPPREA